MKPFLKAVIDWVEGIDRAAKATDDPHHRAILENYKTHVALEFSGRIADLLGEGLTIQEPVYQTKLDGSSERMTHDGHAAVVDFYQKINDTTVLTNQDEKLAVADWGFVSQNTWNMFTTGRHLIEQGIEVEDPDATYRVHRPLLMLWNYTEDAKLIGEEVYEIDAPKIEKIDASEAPTWAEIRDAMKPFLPENQSLLV
ncbi:hypothetical protein ACFTZB_00875 [Rhodococcus sp. NPDC057014]|uniref:hypothetical protein n=1 Tax=Rhodococcus sp. NPDC057014 TaxID=3346000 RepID=UPI0036285273